MTLFGTPADADRLLGIRLAEHAVHTWDIVVMSDAPATIGRLDAARTPAIVSTEGIDLDTLRTVFPGI